MEQEVVIEAEEEDEAACKQRDRPVLVIIAGDLGIFQGHVCRELLEEGPLTASTSR